MIALLMLMQPPPPPSGPISGGMECLFDASTGRNAGQVQFNEAGLPYQGAILADGTPAEYQIEFTQFPIDGGGINDVEFAPDGMIRINAKADGRLVGRFTPIKPSQDGWWMEFSIPDSGGEMSVVGTCLANFRGRLERPIRLTKIMTRRVD